MWSGYAPRAPPGPSNTRSNHRGRPTSNQIRSDARGKRDRRRSATGTPPPAGPQASRIHKTMNKTAKNYARLASDVVNGAGVLPRMFPQVAATAVHGAMIFWDADATWYANKRYRMTEQVRKYTAGKHKGLFLSFVLPALIHAVIRFLLEAYRDDSDARLINQLNADFRKARQNADPAT